MNAFNKADFYTNIRVRTHKKPNELVSKRFARSFDHITLEKSDECCSIQKAFELKLYRNDEASPFAISHFVTNKSLIEHSLEEFELPVLDIKTNKLIGTLKSKFIELRTACWLNAE